MHLMKNISSFIKSNYDLAWVPFLALGLFLFEKLIETDFICPDDEVLGISYSLLFFVITTAILNMLADSGCFCCKVCRKPQNAGDIERGAYHRDRKNSKCSCCCLIFHSILHLVMRYQVSILWLLILLMDGRYLDCFVKSITEYNMKRMTEWNSYSLQIFQMIGLLGILILVAILLNKCDKQSQRYKNKHQNIILHYTQVMLQKEKREKIKASVKKSINVENWDPELWNAEEEWEKITDKCRKDVLNNLREATDDPNQPGADLESAL